MSALPAPVRILVAALAFVAGVPGVVRPAEAQLGALLSPGRLAKAHADLEGLANCTQCHERGQRVTPGKCLTCHTPIADRIAARKGVHKDAAGGCVACHVDHAGPDAELRPFETAGFDHAAVTGFALDGRHAPVAARCETCHKTRSFLTASPACATCHTDPHKGALGSTCQTCHSTSDAFRDARGAFDHSTTMFPLTGAHRAAACTACHADASFRTARRSTTCASCHQTPHPPSMGSTCTACHTTSSWRTRRFDHGTTRYPLVGAHAAVDCAKCHVQPATKVKPTFATCATCHADPHKGEFKTDCAACHTERGFAGAPFDHAKETRFALADGHANLTCRQCHKDVSAASVPIARKALDFRGLTKPCASCHADPHRAELGSACETCHSPKTFRVAAFTHPRLPGLFTGQHAPVACKACHVPKAAVPPGAEPALATATFRGLPSTCASCHVDVHLGQVGTACERCHSVEAAHFAPDRFRHDRAGFKLEGRHALATCENCHKRETRTFPAGPGSAVRLTGLGTACATCHADVHLGQVGTACETCHRNATSFTVKDYRHRTPPRDFFTGRHVSAACAACHTPATADFPGGRGTAIRFDLDPDCVACHTDVHRGSLGRDCITCHKPEPLRSAHLAAAPPVASWRAHP